MHLKHGLSEKEIDKAVEEWKKDRDKVIQDRINAIKAKKEKLKAEKAAAKVAEEEPASAIRITMSKQHVFVIIVCACRFSFVIQMCVAHAFRCSAQ